MHPILQARLQLLLDDLIAQGETGLQIAVYHRGLLVADAWAGAPGRGVDGRSLFPVYSTGKGIAATAIHLLVQRGVLAWDDPIARWWPGFAAHGKGSITLRQALDHTAGLAMLPAQGTMDGLADWDAMCRALADAPPFPAPGTARHYHAITFSWLVGETARRADGRPFARIVAEEIAAPLALDGLFFGVPEAELPRVLDAEAGPSRPAQPAGAATAAPTTAALVAARAIPAWATPLEDLLNRPAVRRACIPASNGLMNARSIARHYAALMGDGVDGIRLLSDATLDEAARPRPLPGEARPSHALGYALSGPDGDPGAVIGHGGYGGSTGFADRRYALAVGFTRSRMNGLPSGPLMAEIRRCLDCP